MRCNFFHHEVVFAKFLNPVRSKIRVPGFDRITRFDRVGRVNFYLKKIQNGIVLVKKKTKVNRLQPGFWLGFAGSTRQVGRVIAYPIFSLTRSGSNTGSAGSRIDPPAGTGFKTMGFWYVRSELFCSTCAYVDKWAGSEPTR
jgi:hypothetical protein